ncbi:hypothetical protein OH76DRAFT_1399571 [Lentinus brumalis]|uniref:P-loop containing nucleoside triphosphate hydrolase protein n=1 Tax=Lentinus brumalis TaxID=2498619 RepID=A0A371DKD3_9APHY|nr:hypothetical protein OH76DRAFT_1399571 [Polyporus brumalis]
MPRIRKKTSNRLTIHKREKLKKQVKASKKKETKKAKKNPQWKSKTPKDPGIPNNFPYKDQILAEVAEQRRIAAEDKQRRKEERKTAKAHAEDGSDDDEAEAAFDGVRALTLSAARTGGPSAADAKTAAAAETDEVEEEEVPVLINPELPNLKAVLDAADALVEVLDARDPLAARSAHLEELAREGGKKVLLVLNKVDTCPREAVEAWAAALRTQYPAVLFRAASACLPVSTADAAPAPAKGKGKGKERERADDAWGLDSATALLRQWAEEHKGDKPFTIAIVGVTNVGKSSFVNSLLRKTALQTYRPSTTSADSPTTTMHPQEVTIDLEGGKQLRVIDTPGLSWHPIEGASPEDVARSKARDILLRSRGRMERMKDPSPVLAELVSRANREDLMLVYNLPIFTDGDANAFLACVARANGFMKKKGEPDLTGAARMILRDWVNGKLARYAQPPPPSSAPSEPDASLAEVYAKDSTVLSKLSTRKELRKAGGIVKLRPAEVDTRKAVLDASYFISSDDEGMEADEEDAATVDDLDEVGMLDDESEGDYVSDEDEEEDEDNDEDEDDEEEEEDVASPPRGKRKRALAKAPARPAKRVAFAPEPKGTKQARSTTGAKKAKGDDKPEPKAKPAAKKPAKAPAPKAAPAKKIANAASAKKKAAALAAADGDAYDFKQFF